MAASALLQWRGLPYGEATFEKAEDIEKAGGAKDIAELLVRPPPPAPRLNAVSLVYCSSITR